MRNNPINFDSSLYTNCISGDQYIKYCNKKFFCSSGDSYYDTAIEPNDVWIIHGDFLYKFFDTLPANCPGINLVVRYSDRYITDEIMNNKPDCIKKLFSYANMSKNLSSVCIPAGLCPPNTDGGVGAPIAKDIAIADTNRNREKLLYVNFRPHTWSEERIPLLQKFEGIKSHNITVEYPDPDYKKFDRYFESLLNHKFCLCPRGAGGQSHRMWESLYSRTVPVVKWEYWHENWKNLPILFVNDWNEITEDFLEQKYAEMCSKEYDFSTLDVSYWGKKFSEF